MSNSKQHTYVLRNYYPDRLRVQRKHLYLLAGLVITLIFIFYILSFTKPGDDAEPTYRNTYSCYHKRLSDLPVDYLEDILLSKRQPTLDTSIFFVITTCLSDSLVAIRRRQACAIESAAHHNPDRDIFVVFASPVGFPSATTDLFDRLTNNQSQIIQTLIALPNVHLRNANMTTFIHGTPMENLELSGSVYRSPWPPVHLADVLRLLVLYRYGGIYMDSDVIVMRSFHDLNPVFFTCEEKEWSNNGVMGTTHDGFGNGFFHGMIDDAAKTYKNNEWGSIGRDVITRFLQRQCKMATAADDNSRCREMKIYPQNMFHPFALIDDSKVWNTTQPNQEMMDRSNSSYTIHLWSSWSNAYKLKVDDRSVVNVIAGKNCPAIYFSADNFNND